MRKWKNQEHSSLQKSLPERTMFLKMQKIILGGRLRIYTTAKSFFRSSESDLSGITSLYKCIKFWAALHFFISARGTLSEEWHLRDRAKKDEKKLKKLRFFWKFRNKHFSIVIGVGHYRYVIHLVKMRDVPSNFSKK